MISIEVRQDMAALVQRSLNSIWESRITSHIREDNIDIEYLNDMVDLYLKTEKAFSEVIFKYKLKVEGNLFLKQTKFKDIPRRMKVTLLENNEQPTREGYVTRKLREFYNGITVSGMSFYLVYNMFSGKITKNFCKEWRMNNKQRAFTLDRFYVKNGETFALLIDIWKSPEAEDEYYALKLDGNLENMFEEVR